MLKEVDILWLQEIFTLLQFTAIKEALDKDHSEFYSLMSFFSTTSSSFPTYMLSCDY